MAAGGVRGSLSFVKSLYTDPFRWFVYFSCRYTFHYDTRKYSFSARIVNIWNSLPNFVVDVDTVCLFKTRLGKFWMHQDVMYDFAADLTGIGDRSVCEIK